MCFQKLKNGVVPIELIDNQEKLLSMINTLKLKKEIAFDTEFDRFKREYGFKLLLLQIFDGKTCFLIDPKSIKSLKPLWVIFNNSEICKVVYSGREDVDLLKRNGCNPKNLFDIQVASALCNIEGRSFSSLLYKILEIKLDKKEQTSNWCKRPLELGQLIYASNDVIYLLKLKELILNSKRAANVFDFINEENLILEEKRTKDFTPKLSTNQIQKFTKNQSVKLFKMIVLRNKFAKEFNLPPYKLVSDNILESIIINPSRFSLESFNYGFSKKAKESKKFKNEFNKIINAIEDEISSPKLNVENSESINPIVVKKPSLEYRNLRFDSFKEFVISHYGDIAGALILEGLSKRFSSEQIIWVGAKKYQINLYKNFLEITN
jgi:ribonuclease D